MKDSIITAHVKRRELVIWLICFAIANVTNWISIVRFSAPWYEVFTQIGYVVILSLVIYFLLALVRVAWWMLSRIFDKK